MSWRCIGCHVKGCLGVLVSPYFTSPALRTASRSGSRKPAPTEASCPLSKLFEEPEKPPPTGRPPAPPRAAPREEPLTPR